MFDVNHLNIQMGSICWEVI